MLSIKYVFFPGWPKHCASMELRPIGRWWSCEGRCEGGPSENCLLKINNMVSIFFAISNHQFSLISIAGLVQRGFHVQQRQHQLLWVRDIKNSFFSNCITSQPINSSRGGSATGHYTQVIWAETDRLGCGTVYYKVNIKTNWEPSTRLTQTKLRHITCLTVPLRTKGCWATMWFATTPLQETLWARAFTNRCQTQSPSHPKQTLSKEQL